MEKTRIFKKSTIYFSVLLVACSLLLILVVLQVCSFFFLSFDQFNVFTKYKQTYPLETWDIPQNVDIDINDDGDLDRIAWNGCITLSGTNDSDIVPNQYDCPEGEANKLTSFTPKKSPKHQVFLSYVGQRQNDQLEIVVMQNLGTEVYRFENNQMKKIKPDFSLRMDTLLYFFSHLFVLIIGM